MQVTDQMANALFLFDRPDIAITYAAGDSLRQALMGITGNKPVFLVSSNQYAPNFLDNLQVSNQLTYKSEHGVFDGYL